MICRKCGSVLPSHGYICPSCGLMMDKEQIEMQKQNNKGEFKKEYNSDKYGVKKDIKYNDERKTYGAAVVIIIVFLIVLSVILYLIKG